jgi:hypothetical protein
MKPRLAVPMAAVAAFGVFAYAGATRQAALARQAAYEELIEEGFGRIDAVPTQQAVLHSAEAGQPFKTSRIFAARPE